MWKRSTVAGAALAIAGAVAADDRTDHNLIGCPATEWDRSAYPLGYDSNPWMEVEGSGGRVYVRDFVPPKYWTQEVQDRYAEELEKLGCAAGLPRRSKDGERIFVRCET